MDGQTDGYFSWNLYDDSKCLPQVIGRSQIFTIKTSKLCICVWTVLVGENKAQD